MGSILSMQWPVSTTKRQHQVPSVLLIIAGAVHQLRGRVAVIRGTLSHNDILRAQGYRQQLVGMLQRFWKQDRKSVEAWVDALLRRGVAYSPVKSAYTPVKSSWRANTVAPILHVET